MDCTNCGAPLPARSNICGYCNTLNETDLRTARTSAAAGRTSERDCPRCTTNKLTTMLIPGFDGVEIDRCAECHGIFFDPGELEGVMNRSVQPFTAVDKQELQRLIDEERGFEKKVVYVRCPECKQLMDRKVHGRKSGIVVDRCPQHGVWLDGGELGALLKWAAAGGHQHTTDVRERELQHAAERARTRAVIPDRVSRVSGWKTGAGNESWLAGNSGDGIGELLGFLVELFD